MIYYELNTLEGVETWLRELPFVKSTYLWYPEKWGGNPELSMIIYIPWYIWFFGQKRFKKFIIKTLTGINTPICNGNMTFNIYLILS